MVVKTYPTPSKKYHETVCTAGITSTGEWIRLYPLIFRYLNHEQQFSKYSLIDVDVLKNTQDNRPESYKIKNDSVKVIKTLDPQKDIEERKRFLLPLCSDSFEAIQNKYKEDKTSLGLFQPKEVYDLIVSPAEKDWTPAQKEILNQTSMFDKEFKQLEKVPWDFSFHFKCNADGCKGHNVKITDWELYQAFRNFRKYYGDEKTAIEKLKEKYLGYFRNPKRDSYFIVGTVHPWPTFIIIGVFSYLKNDTVQTDFFDLIKS